MRTRIRQELVLGVGGVKALRALGIMPGVYHLNEGHSAFAPLEVIRQRMARRRTDVRRSAARRGPAHGVHHAHAGAGRARPLRRPIWSKSTWARCATSWAFRTTQLMGLGRVEPQNEHEPFCMTVIGLKLSRRANAVSSLHGHVSRRMWAHLWPWRVEEEIPIGHITNGVHIPTWLAYPMHQLYDRVLAAPTGTSGWASPKVWQNIYNVDPGELWETHNALKNRLLDFVRRRVSRQCRRRNEIRRRRSKRPATMLDPNALTIGFARRFATYKRADLFFRQFDALAELVNDPQRPVQFIFAGKAHPADEPGKQLIKKIANLRHDPRFAGPRSCSSRTTTSTSAGTWCRASTCGSTTPRRPLEASGTSGMKAVLNGGLNLLDSRRLVGRGLQRQERLRHRRRHGSTSTTRSPTRRDAREPACACLRDEVIPLFYDRDADGLPRQWIEMMVESIATLAPRFSAHRMVMDYVRNCYLVAAGGLSSEMNRR